MLRAAAERVHKKRETCHTAQKCVVGDWARRAREMGKPRIEDPMQELKLRGCTPITRSLARSPAAWNRLVADSSRPTPVERRRGLATSAAAYTESRVASRPLCTASAHRLRADPPKVGIARRILCSPQPDRPSSNPSHRLRARARIRSAACASNGLGRRVEKSVSLSSPCRSRRS